jgi:hypothetical protein
MRKRIKQKVVKTELIGKTLFEGKNFIKIASLDKPEKKKKQFGK